MRQQQFEVESLGPVIRAIEKREQKLKGIRLVVTKEQRRRLDLRLRALERSRQILSEAYKTAPKMNAFYAGADD